MKNILLVYLPFCTPASPSYSIANLYSFLKANSRHNIEVLDLNLEFHRLKFPEFQFHNLDNYDSKAKEFIRLSAKTYSENNKKVVNGEKPEFFDELLRKIKDKKPDIIAFSIVYSSQAFYAYSLAKELKNVVIGGPAVNEKLSKVAKVLNNELELLNYIEEKETEHNKLNLNFPLDFSIYNLNEYFTPCPVIPIKTSTTCYYRRCAFCSHYSSIPYFEFPLDIIKKTVINSKQKYFFLIDDMIPVKRLLKIAETFRPLNISWTCQLRPTKEFNYKILKQLKESGLTMIMWGVESGNQRILDLINKGTDIEDIEKVLFDSYKAGIRNILYILFGFPSETEKEFLDTIRFLKKNEKNIDLVSTSIFGLQKNTAVYNNPSKFGITKITEEKRTILGPKLSYKVKEGLTQEQASELRAKYKKTIESVNKFPKRMNFFREHMLLMC